MYSRRASKKGLTSKGSLCLTIQRQVSGAVIGVFKGACPGDVRDWSKYMARVYRSLRHPVCRNRCYCLQTETPDLSIRSYLDSGMHELLKASMSWLSLPPARCPCRIYVSCPFVRHGVFWDASQCARRLYSWTDLRWHCSRQIDIFIDALPNASCKALPFLHQAAASWCLLHAVQVMEGSPQS